MIQNRWNDEDANKVVANAGDNLADQTLALRVYSSRLIGQDPNLVLHGGGNTSCKVQRQDFFGDTINVLHIKGSGWDLATIQNEGMPGVRLDPLLKLKGLDTLSDTEMVNFQRANLLDTNAPNPSVETLMHAFLPHNFIDHTHATPILALASLPNLGEAVQEIFGGRLAFIPFTMSGLGLAKMTAQAFEANPDIEGIILARHGHLVFGDTAKQSYDRLIEQTNLVEAWLKEKTGAAPAKATIPPLETNKDLTQVLPLLRGIIGDANANFSKNPDEPMPVLDIRNGDNVQDFFSQQDLSTMSRRGVGTPDHVIRTKNYPLYLNAKQVAGGHKAITDAVNDYISAYKTYFEHNNTRFNNTKTMLSPTPNLAWIEGVGLVGISSNAKTASIASDIGEQNLAVMTSGEASGGFYPVTEEQVFEMEYWSLEQAKLKQATLPTMQGRVVMVTGGGGAIGLATAKEFATLGANIFLVDLEENALQRALEKLGDGHHGIALDVTTSSSAQEAMDACVARFGGLDILVSNAGAAWTGELVDLDDETLRKSFELNFFAHLNFSKAAAAVFKLQNRGGQILFNVSKQAVNPGKGFGAYGLPKATTFFLLRQLALELGPLGIRVNGINADRIRSGLLDEEFVAKRSKARGIDEKTYMAGNLLGKEVEAFHVGQAFVALATSERTTAHVLTVDGGNIEAALR